MSGARVRRAPTRDFVGTPALDTWRTELAGGLRAPTTFDALWRAACAEVAALEAPVPEIRDNCLAEARRIIESARKGGAA